MATTPSGMNFGTLLAQQRNSARVVPSELYEALPNKAKNYGYLRLVQGKVLEQWHQRRQERDLVVKVNTGGGKTIDGLIILQSLINEGHGPALYVAPDNLLVDQVVEEAGRLGLRVVQSPDDPLYLRSQAICVVNAHKLFNGRSVFASTRSPKTPAPIGSVVIDDAHAAIATTRQQLSIRVSHEHVVYQALLGLFEPDLQAYSANDLLNVKDRAFGTEAQVPYWAWRAKVDRVRRILRQHSDEDGIKFSLPPVIDVLPVCRAVFSGQELSITPPCPPIQHLTNFLRAKHRIYLTATLADDGVLVTDFDADPESVRKPITPETAGDIGERMILAPQEIEPAIESEEIRKAAKLLAVEYNVVVLVPSKRASEIWAKYGARIASPDDLGHVVAQLRDPGTPPQLVVLVNKYDGIDLPDDACRVLIVDGLPEAFSPEERVESRLTTRTAGTDDRQVQRLEQGMGRAVRSNEDHCVVLLLGHRLSQLVAHPDTATRFGPATQAQLKLAAEIEQAMSANGLEGIMRVVRQVLERDPDWVSLAKSAISGLPSQAGHVADEAVAKREAFNKFVDGDSRAAAQALAVATERSSDPRVAGWLLQQQAVYVDQYDPSASQVLLTRARTLNKDVLRPLVRAPYVPLEPAGVQAERVLRRLREFSTLTEMGLAFNAVLGDLQFDPHRTEEFEEAMLQLGALIGVASERPEKETGEGPDNLWGLSSTEYWVIEAKSGAITNFIKKGDVNQLAGSANWFTINYTHGETPVPVMVHPARVLGKGASVVQGMRILDSKGLTQLVANARAFAEALSNQDLHDVETIGTLLKGHDLSVDQLGSYLVSTSR